MAPASGLPVGDHGAFGLRAVSPAQNAWALPVTEHRVAEPPVEVATLRLRRPRVQAAADVASKVRLPAESGLRQVDAPDAVRWGLEVPVRRGSCRPDPEYNHKRGDCNSPLHAPHHSRCAQHRQWPRAGRVGGSLVGGNRSPSFGDSKPVSTAELDSFDYPNRAEAHESSSSRTPGSGRCSPRGTTQRARYREEAIP